MIRLLVYGMQSSGASWITWMLGQHDGWIVIPDILGATPLASDFDDCADLPGVIVKCTAWPGETLQDQIERFRPAATILVRRDAAAIRASLARKWYGTAVDAKFAAWSESLAAGLHDRLIDYESYQPPPVRRSLDEIVRFNMAVSHWCRWGRKRIHTTRGDTPNMPLWGLGGIRTDPGTPTAPQASRVA